MITGMISTGSHASFHTIFKSKHSTQTSVLQPSSHLSFNNHFSKPSFSLRTHSKSVRTTMIKASATSTEAAVDNIYTNTQTFYDLLGISEGGTLSEIKKAYKQLARKYHPDVSPPGCTAEYTKRFIQVQEAYETLSDPKSKALYDRDIAGGLDLHMIFSSRKRSCSGEGFHEDTIEWKERWQSQLTELIRMSNYNDMESMSWGAKMRSQKICRN